VLTYDTLKKKPKELLALTGLALREFEELLPAFTKALVAAEAANQPKPKKRKRAPGAGRKPGLRTPEDKLLFALVYTKTYPLQIVQGQLFGMSQSSANEWIHQLLPVLKAALDELGVLPERQGTQVAAHERRQAEGSDLVIDGVERRRLRPKDQKIQAIHYSGKKKAHCDKNLVVVNTRSKRVSFLSETLPGSVHDKALADHAAIRYPKDATLRSDLGFYGYTPEVREHLQPKKKPKNQELKPGEKRHNRYLSRTRVRVEHAIAGVKISRIAKDQFRNTAEGLSDTIMVIACGLHNLRVTRRARRHRASQAYFR
jgi:hypothetical protein